MNKPMHNLVATAPLSWHVVDATTLAVVDHTHREAVASEDWVDIYDGGELVIECRKELSGRFALSACCWWDQTGLFQMQVTHVSKEVAVQMFAAAYKVAIQAENQIN